MPQDFPAYESPSYDPSSPSLGPSRETVTKMRGDMKFVGLFTIISGALTCLSIIGAVIGIPYIIMGLRLREAADAFNRFDALDDRDALRRAFEKQRSYFFINKVLIIIGLVIFALYILGIIALVVFGISSGDFGTNV